MQIRKIIVALLLAGLAVFLTSCASTGDDSVPCTPQAVDPNTDPNCIAGGEICGTSEGQMCKDNTWPIPNDHCTTVYLLGGTCRCSCK